MSQKYAQVIETNEPPVENYFMLPGDLILVLYEYEDKVYAKNLMLEGPNFDFIQSSSINIIDLPNSVYQNENSIFVGICDFLQCESGDLEFRKNELIVGEKPVDENWTYGYCLTDQSKQGIFPLTHVRKVFISDRDVTKYVNFDIPPRQAKIIKPTSSGLKGHTGEYILITGQLNEFLYYGENLDLDKNFIPNDFFVYIDENAPVLTHTQHYLIQDKQFCVVNYDFMSENPSDLGCLQNERLEIIEEVNPEWLKCKNSHGQIGLVPKNYVNTETTLTDSINSLPNYDKSHSMIISPKRKTGKELRSQSLTPEIMKNLSKNPPPRPPKPPKQIIEQSLNSSQNSNQDTFNDFLFKFMDMKTAEIGPEKSPEKTKEISLEDQIKRKEKKQNDRFYCLKELVETEKNYYNELHICYDCFMSENLLLEVEVCPNEFNRSLLFDKLIPIINLSKNLIESFDSELNQNQNDYLKCKFSVCFLKFLEQMKMVYAQYARNHDEIVIVLKKYEQTPEINDYINKKLTCIKNKLSAADLSALLIKPVQRIFKYPLFVKRIIDSMEKSDEEYAGLEQLQTQLSLMLDFINEYKRRQDLISKYLNRPSLIESIPQTSITKKVKTFKKLTGRFSLQITNVLGWTNQQVKDEYFGSIENNYRLVEKVLRNYFNDLNSYLADLRSVLDCEKDIFNDLLFIFDDEFETYHKFDLSSNKRRSLYLQEYADALVKQVLTPINLVKKSYNGPNKLISKRNDKLLDYENALLDSEYRGLNPKESENNRIKTKKDYEALNSQLIEELPILTEVSCVVLSKSFKIFGILTNNFINQIHLSLKEDINSSKIDLSLQFCRNTSSKRVSKLTNAFNRQSLLISNDFDQKLEIIKPTQTEKQREKVFETYPIDQIYIVTQKYVANLNLCQLNQNINDIVGLKKPYTPSGDKNTWFVFNGQTEGFIPALVLEPYKNYYNQNNLICFDEVTDGRQELVTINEEKYCVAMYNFKSIAYNTIDIIEGEIYKVIEDRDKIGSSEWCLIEDKNCQIGYVPKNFVNILE